MLGADGYRTKKELKASIGQPLQYEETSFFGPEFKPNGWNSVVGPDAYRQRKWYANVRCEKGVIQEVK